MQYKAPKAKHFYHYYTLYTDKKENEIFLIYEKIQMGSVAKSYMWKGFLINEEMRKNLP